MEIRSLGEIVPCMRHTGRVRLSPADGSRVRIAYDQRLFAPREGEIEIVAGPVNRKIGPGEVCLIGSGIPYRIGAAGERAVVLACNFDFFGGPGPEDGEAPIPLADPEGFEPNGLRERVSFTGGFLGEGAAVFALDPEGEGLLKLLEEEFLYVARFHRVAAAGYFAALLARLARGGTSPDRREDFLSYILAHYTEDLTYRHMGEVFHYHPNYISHVVREKTGLPLRRYLLRLRVRQASRLLLDKEVSVEEVAAQVGFRDVSYFVQYFKKVTGMTPGELRGR
ncbi:MAG: helix-turn-helix domain-containing protein [Clostridia bacterium]|nr:helix-turn-helix domain-containing protein [Clostridia bacterium]